MSLILKTEIPEAHAKPIKTIAFNPNRRELYVSGDDGSINIWEVESQKLVNTFTHHTGWVTGMTYS